MWIKRLILIACCLLLQDCASLRAPQELQRGKMDFAAGDYKKSFRELLPLASEGNADAEYAVGYMYYYGLGAPEDSETGIFWMQKAADQHQERAVSALKMIQQKK